MRRIALDYDRLAKLAEEQLADQKEERLAEKLRTDCSLRPGLASVRMKLCGFTTTIPTGFLATRARNDLAERGIEPVIPPRSNRKVPIEYDREAYKRRNLIERCVNRLKQFRRIATRYEKTARAYLSMLCIASSLIWIKTVNAA